MMRLRGWALRIAALFGAGRRDRDIDAEIETHLRMIEDEYVRGGLPRDEARRRAGAAFGSVPAVAEAYRDRRGIPAIEHAIRDCRHAARSLARSPVLALSMILVLGLGIGLSTVVASVFDTAVWRTLPVPEPDRVVKLALGLSGEVDRRVRGHRSWFSYPELTEYRAATRSFDAVAGFFQKGVIWRADAEPRRLSAALVTSEYFPVVRTGAAAGRVLGPADARQPVVVIGHRLWKESFGGTPDAINRTMILDRAAYAIVGVAAEGFTGTDTAPVDLWLPLEAAMALAGEPGRLSEENLSWLQLVGRLTPGVSLQTAAAEAALIAPRFDDRYPGRRTTISITRASLIDAGFLQARERGKLLAAGAGVVCAVALLLLICGSNVAALLLARGATRHQEIALRVALGAGRARIAQELLAEVLVIGLAATLVGIATHLSATRVIAAWLPPVRGLVVAIPDLRLFAFAAASAFGVSTFFGLAPLRQALSVDCLEGLKGQSSLLGTRVTGMRLRHALASSQVAVSVVLLVVTALLARGLDRAFRVDPGYAIDNIYAVQAEFDGPGDPTARRWQFVGELRDRLAREPGVVAVGLASLPPFFGKGFSSVRTGQMPSFEPVQFNAIDGQYFRALGIEPVAGRIFAPGETGVVLVNSSLARKYWGSDAAALDQTLQFPSHRQSDPPRTATIVGVVPTIQTTDVGVDDGPSYYLPLPESAPRAASEIAQMPAIVVKSSTTTPLPRTAMRLVREMDPGTLATTVSIEDRIGAMTGPARAGRAIAGLIGTLALLVAAVGIHGIIAHAVIRRTRDIGVYLALGASRMGVLRAVFGRTLRAVAVGAGAGLGLVTLLGIAFWRGISAALFGLAPLDPWALLTATAFLSAVALAAVYLPARRALRIDPAAALRIDA